MFDDAHLFNVIQGLVIMLPLLADKLPGKLQLLLPGWRHMISRVLPRIGT